jgi:hypothetical protein
MASSYEDDRGSESISTGRARQGPYRKKQPHTSPRTGRGQIAGRGGKGGRTPRGRGTSTSGGGGGLVPPVPVLAPPRGCPTPPRRTAGPWPVGRQHQHPTPPTPSNSSPRFPAIITRTCHRPASSPARFAAPGRHPRAAQANQPSPSRPPSPVDSSLSLSLSRLPAASAASRHRPIPPHPQPPSALARARRALSTADSTTSLYCFAPSSPISSGIASRGEGYFWCYC